MDTELISDDIRYFAALAIALAIAALPAVAVAAMSMMDKVVRGQSRVGMMLGVLRPYLM